MGQHTDMMMQDVMIADKRETRKSALQIEDMIGKFVLLTYFLWHLYNAGIATAASLVGAHHDLMWWLSFVSHATSLGFVAMIVWLTITRSAPVDVAPGIEARISAFLGTFILLGLMAVPHAPLGEAQMLIGTTFIIVGTVSSIWCIKWLGSAFSVMAAARNLVTTGPYAHVRHPLYTAEALTVIGVIITNGTFLGLLIGSMQFFFQYRRMINEEKVLSAVHPSYAAYKAVTPRVIPRLLSRSTKAA
jgi:protein-S-isoprenylcysteine O-methyltransferase Ste14